MSTTQPPGYREAITAENTTLGRDPRTLFIGYGLTRGRALGTLRDVPAERILETPVAENLMMGAALGLALSGRRPVVFIERMDFLCNALDALVNHADKLPALSRGEFGAGIIVRCIVGNRTKPLFTGATHTQDFTEPLRLLLPHSLVFPVRDPEDARLYYGAAKLAQVEGRVTVLVEYKDLY